MDEVQRGSGYLFHSKLALIDTDLIFLLRVEVFEHICNVPQQLFELRNLTAFEVVAPRSRVSVRR
jgi:hypothetical protein